MRLVKGKTCLYYLADWVHIEARIKVIQLINNKINDISNYV